MSLPGKRLIYIHALIERQVKMLKALGFTDEQIVIEDNVDGIMVAVARKEKQS